MGVERRGRAQRCKEDGKDGDAWWIGHGAGGKKELIVTFGFLI